MWVFCLFVCCVFVFVLWGGFFGCLCVCFIVGFLRVGVVSCFVCCCFLWGDGFVFEPVGGGGGASCVVLYFLLFTCFRFGCLTYFIFIYLFIDKFGGGDFVILLYFDYFKYEINQSQGSK